MVYQDYELIATKRVGHQRRKGFLLMKRQFEALGGMNTVYMTTFCGMAGSAFGMTMQTQALVRPLMSSAGMASVARTGVMAGGPAIVGFIMGVQAFGDAGEFRNLLMNAGTYSREIKAVQKEHYY